MKDDESPRSTREGPPGRVFEDEKAQAVYERIWRQHEEAFRRLAKL